MRRHDPPLELPRRRAHIDRGERAFLPLDRMRAIRWEESVAHAEARRAGLREHMLRHHNCHCGSIACLGVPIVYRFSKKAGAWVPAKLG